MYTPISLLEQALEKMEIKNIFFENSINTIQGLYMKWTIAYLPLEFFFF